MVTVNIGSALRRICGGRGAESPMQHVPSSSLPSGLRVSDPRRYPLYQPRVGERLVVDIPAGLWDVILSPHKSAVPQGFLRVRGEQELTI